MTDKIQRSVNVETPKAHIKLSECLPDRSSTFFDVSEVFKVNSQIILRLAVIDIHYHNKHSSDLYVEIPNFCFWHMVT